MNRRVFMGQVVSFGLGLLALGNGRISWAKVLPSDPEGTTIGSARPHVIARPTFEKNGGFALEKALVSSGDAYDFMN
jgi:hypothetical protein